MPSVRDETITLHLERRDGVLGLELPIGAGRLDDEVGEELTERVAALPARAAVRLQVHVPGRSPRDDIPAIIRHHFALRRERAQYRLKRVVRAGRQSLIVGLAILALALAVLEIIRLLLSGEVWPIVEEGLMIVGWVALWRPLDQLLFERWALRWDIALYRRLERMEISVVPQDAYA